VPTVTMTVRGSDQLRRNLDRLAGAQRRQAQRDGLEAGARIVETHAKINTTPNVDTGTLRNSIQVDSVTPTQAIIAPHTDYAEYLEFGTSRMQAYPYMRPAIDEHEGEIVAAVADTVAAFVESVRA
jgi:HK97 gp10 family phage protein